MLKSLKELSGFTIQATDGDIGTVDDFYFEEDTWKIRYVIVDTGHWLPGRRVLLAPVAIGRPDWENRKLPVALTRQRVRESPEFTTDLPLLRTNEFDLHQHYLWEPYWLPGFTGVGESLGLPYGPIPVDENEEEPEPEVNTRAARLHSVSATLGDDILATDGSVGHLEDFIFDEMAWVIRWLAVDTGVWIAGKKVLIPTNWVTNVDQTASTIQLDLEKKLIESSPDYDPSLPVGPQLEAQLESHYRAA